MSADNSHDREHGRVSERATEIQSPEMLGASIDLSIPTHVAQHPDAPQVAGYVLTELLGEGAYGQVWRAWQIRTRKEVAVKVFKQRSGLDWILLQREVERLMRLDRHPHVVTLLDAGLESDPPYYVIDLLEGGSLQQFVDPQGFAPVPRVIDWALEICDALSYVHRKGLIHCDLKPANILIDDEKRVRVVDFGQSRVFNESSAGLGTLFYMPPEQATLAELGQPVQPDVRWDIYALGATLYSVLSGQVPHATKDNMQALERASALADRLDRYRGIIRAGGIDPRDPALLERAGPELAAIVAKCLAPRPEDRYESVAELRADLLALRAGRPVSPLAHHRGYRLRKFIRRNPFGVGLAAAICVLAVGGAAMRMLNVRLDERKAQHILTTFEENPSQAVKRIREASPRVSKFLIEDAAEDMVSSASTRRMMAARSAPWSSPDAFWASVDGGPLWRFGEWLELVEAASAEPQRVIGQLRAKAASGSDRQKYAAFCLIGQIAASADKDPSLALRAPTSNPSLPLGALKGDPALVEFCAKAAASESHPGVVAAANWAAKRLGKQVPPRNCEAIRVDDISDLTFVKVTGCESFRRGSPPDEKDRWPDEAMPETGRPIQTIFLAMTEVTAGAFAPFANDPAMATWLGTLASVSANRRETLWLFAQSLQSQLDRGATDEAVAWVSLEMARRYCEWLTSKGASASPPRRYRLPTEDEWEYACRAGNPGRFCFGDSAEYASFFASCNGDGGPAVAQHMPNFNGLFDMHGGLWEWTNSRYPPELMTDPAVPANAKQNLYVLRGGAYYSPEKRCRSAQRNCCDASEPNRYWGFRIVMEESQR